MFKGSSSFTQSGINEIFLMQKFKNLFKLYHKIRSIDFSEVLCDDRFIWKFLVQNWHVSEFLCHLFGFRNVFSARIRSILSSHTIRTCFHIKLLQISLESVNFTSITTCTDQDLYFTIIAISPRYLFRKVRHEFCECCVLLGFFFFFFKSGLTGRVEE